MSIKDDYVPVRKDRPCPICGRADWCLVSRDDLENPSKAICARIESPRRWGEAGYLHILHEQPRRPVVRSYLISAPTTVRDYSAQAEWYVSAAKMYGAIERLAGMLYVLPDALRKLWVGWSVAENCWTFPLRDPENRIVGINRRWASGDKLIVKGHKAGLYLPHLPTGMEMLTLLVCEGGTDTAAALSMGLWAVGRFSCNSGTGMVRHLVRAKRPRLVVVVADGDGPGRKGAEDLVRDLLPVARAVKLVEPPAKDLRAWHRAGAEYPDLAALIEAAPARRMVIGGAA